MKKALYFMSGFYVMAGINHFLHPEIYEKIMPSWLSWHKALIIFTGILEILFGLLLIPRLTRIIAAWCIIALLIVVFPANVQMMLNYLHQDDPLLWLTIARLPIQLVLIWFAHFFTKTSYSIK
ncbi:MAG: DoxX family protein [Ginsengibacter sp.]